MEWDADKFFVYDPYATFSSSGRRFVKSTGESSFAGWLEPLDDDEQALWILGKTSFDALNVSSSDDFYRAYQTYVDGMRANREMLDELSGNGTILTQDFNGKRYIPDWSVYPSEEVLTMVWQIFSQIPEGERPPESHDLFRKSFLFACFKCIERALVAYMLEGRGLVSATLGAASAFANAEALASVNPDLATVRRNFAYKGAMERLRRDPKQMDKARVYTYWIKWQENPNLYQNQAEFARDMLEKFGKESNGSLTSTDTIVKKWIPVFRKLSAS
ncbi:hypothetical protein [Burkholderia gladioli]|uniref:hypothetical protein n=1 Tax=Burkholderia gladioli TaxID=28095 RepID=UPI001ABAD62F|nr:hypothetical protein [Burkholderia gladioli]